MRGSRPRIYILIQKTPDFLEACALIKNVLGRHCDSGSTLFSQRAFYYEAVRFVSDI